MEIVIRFPSQMETVFSFLSISIKPIICFPHHPLTLCGPKLLNCFYFLQSLLPSLRSPRSKDWKHNCCILLGVDRQCILHHVCNCKLSCLCMLCIFIMIVAKHLLVALPYTCIAAAKCTVKDSCALV